MKKLILEVEAENEDDLKYALQEAYKQAEAGYKSGDLRNEDIAFGYWKLENVL